MKMSKLTQRLKLNQHTKNKYIKNNNKNNKKKNLQQNKKIYTTLKIHFFNS